tara:strand:- start:1735 stop:2448 length:714 start_codon:yes stop_codon:yes gene_type:complete
MTNLNWGEPIENFPTGGWDIYDGEVVLAEYETGKYNTQIHVVVSPESYEYEKKGLPYDADDQAQINYWYSMGGNADTYQVSEDGMTATGSQPNRNTRAVKFILALREHAGVSMEGSDLSGLKGAKAHWKGIDETNRNPNTQENVTRTHFYPVSPQLGESGGSVNESDVAEAHDLLRAVLSAHTEDSIRIREIAQKALEFEDDYSTETITLASNPDTIEGAVRAGILTKVGERAVSLS